MTQAIIELAGHQYFVKEGDVFTVDKHLDQKEGETLTTDQVLLVVADDKSTIGTPTVADATVSLKVEALGKGEKIHVSRFKSKSRYRRKIGHRQPQTRLLVTNITLK